MKKFFKLYTESRIVHINVNAVISALISLFISAHFVYLTKYVTHDPFTIVIMSYLIDGTVDFLIFAVLHMLIYMHLVFDKKLSMILAKDIALLQSHRLAFTIVTFVVGGGIQLLLIFMGVHRTPAFIIGYFFGIIANRAVHTWYGIKKGVFKPLKKR